MASRPENIDLKFVMLKKDSDSVSFSILSSQSLPLDPVGPICDADSNMLLDSPIRYENAEIDIRGREWFIKNVGGSSPIIIGNKEIGHHDKMQFSPGTPIKTGDNLWTIVPDNWIIIRHNDLVIYVPARKYISYALCQFDTPLIENINIRNIGQQTSTDFKLEFQIEGYSELCCLTVPKIEPGDYASIKSPKFRLYSDKLMALNSFHEGRICITIRGDTVVRITEKIDLFGNMDLVQDDSIYKTIGIFRK